MVTSVEVGAAEPVAGLSAVFLQPPTLSIVERISRARVFMNDNCSTITIVVVDAARDVSAGDNASVEQRTSRLRGGVELDVMRLSRRPTWGDLAHVVIDILEPQNIGRIVRASPFTRASPSSLSASGSGPLISTDKQRSPLRMNRCSRMKYASSPRSATFVG